MQTLSRRAVLALAAGGAAAAMTVGRAAAAFTFTDFSPEAKAQLDATGRPYLIEFWAKWCNTCRTQHEAIDALFMAKPEYEAIPVLRIDWDLYVNGPLVAEWKIPRRSTFLIMKSGTEVFRSVAQTDPAEIEAVFKMALEA